MTGNELFVIERAAKAERRLAKSACNGMPHCTRSICNHASALEPFSKCVLRSYNGQIVGAEENWTMTVAARQHLRRPPACIKQTMMESTYTGIN